MRQLFLCFISVALLGRWQARPSHPPFHMLVRVIVYQSPVLLELWETSHGASFHLKYPEIFGVTGGSGTFTVEELRDFQAALESHGVWSLPSQPSRRDRVVVVLTQGDRHHRVVLSNQDKQQEWLLAPEGLILRCFEKAGECPD